jgi:hypothetical protein
VPLLSPDELIKDALKLVGMGTGDPAAKALRDAFDNVPGALLLPPARATRCKDVLLGLITQILWHRSEGGVAQFVKVIMPIYGNPNGLKDYGPEEIQLIKRANAFFKQSQYPLLASAMVEIFKKCPHLELQAPVVPELSAPAKELLKALDPVSHKIPHDYSEWERKRWEYLRNETVMRISPKLGRTPRAIIDDASSLGVSIARREVGRGEFQYKAELISYIYTITLNSAIKMAKERAGTPIPRFCESNVYLDIRHPSDLVAFILESNFPLCMRIKKGSNVDSLRRLEMNRSPARNNPDYWRELAVILNSVLEDPELFTYIDLEAPEYAWLGSPPRKGDALLRYNRRILDIFFAEYLWPMSSSQVHDSEIVSMDTPASADPDLDTGDTLGGRLIDLMTSDAVSATLLYVALLNGTLKRVGNVQEVDIIFKWCWEYVMTERRQEGNYVAQQPQSSHRFPGQKAVHSEAERAGWDLKIAWRVVCATKKEAADLLMNLKAGD